MRSVKDLLDILARTEHLCEYCSFDECKENGEPCVYTDIVTHLGKQSYSVWHSMPSPD